MAYRSKHGRRPDEYASKSAHSHVVKDPLVQEFLRRSHLPKRSEEVEISSSQRIPYEPVADNPIRHIVAIDGGYDEVVVRAEFPSSTVCFFQFGALIFGVDDLENLEEEPFIDPDDMSKLKRIQRLKLVLPVRNVILEGESTLTDSVRRALYEFFCREMEDGRLVDTLCWSSKRSTDRACPRGPWRAVRSVQPRRSSYAAWR